MQKDIWEKKDCINQPQPLYIIHLHQLNFHAPIGVYEEERILGNLLEFCMDVHYTEPHQYDSIHDTLNYELLFRIVEARMKQPYSLLESLAADIIHTVHERFPRVTAVKISIIKKNPPISGCRGDVGITISQSFVGI